MSYKKETERKQRIATTGTQSSPEDQTGQSSTPQKITDEVLSQKTQKHQWMRDEEHSVIRALDETKDNIAKSIDEARREIPRYTQIVTDYQEQSIQASREIADTYLESQKEIIKSFQSTWVPYVENVYGAFWNNWVSPRRMTEAYTQIVRNIAHNMISTTRLTNDMIFANMQGLKTSMEHTKHNSQEISRISANTARKFEQTTRDAADAAKRAVVSDTPPRIHLEE